MKFRQSMSIIPIDKEHISVENRPIEMREKRLEGKELQRQGEVEGRLTKKVAEIILENEQNEMYERVTAWIRGKTGFKPLKWQLHTMIYLEGLKSLEQKMTRGH